MRSPRRRSSRSPSRSRRHPLRLTPYAWAKLCFLRDLGPTEVGGFGISTVEDPFLVEDVRLVPQLCTSVTVRFQDEGVADYFDDQVDLGRSPAEFARIWIHTHPGNSAHPSHVDEITFEEAFGNTDWAVMLILAQEGQTYARLRFGIGPTAELIVPVRIDDSAPFPASDHAAWMEEFANCVVVDPLEPLSPLRDGESPCLISENFPWPPASSSLGPLEFVDV